MINPSKRAKLPFGILGGFVLIGLLLLTFQFISSNNSPKLTEQQNLSARSGHDEAKSLQNSSIKAVPGGETDLSDEGLKNLFGIAQSCELEGQDAPGGQWRIEGWIISSEPTNPAQLKEIASEIQTKEENLTEFIISESSLKLSGDEGLSLTLSILDENKYELVATSSCR